MQGKNPKMKQEAEGAAMEEGGEPSKAMDWKEKKKRKMALIPCDRTWTERES